MWFNCYACCNATNKSSLTYLSKDTKMSHYSFVTLIGGHNNGCVLVLIFVAFWAESMLQSEVFLPIVSFIFLWDLSNTGIARIFH